MLKFGKVLTILARTFAKATISLINSSVVVSSLVLVRAASLSTFQCLLLCFI